MKKYLFLLLIIAGCSTNNPVTTPPPSGGGETLLIDRTGITDSIHSNNWLVVFNQYFDFPYSQMRVSFEIKGNPINTQNWFYIRKRTEAPFFVFFKEYLDDNYISHDSTISLPSFADTINANLNCNVGSSWIVLRDLKIYGK